LRVKGIEVRGKSSQRGNLFQNYQDLWEGRLQEGKREKTQREKGGLDEREVVVNSSIEFRGMLIFDATDCSTERELPGGESLRHLRKRVSWKKGELSPILHEKQFLI